MGREARHGMGATVARALRAAFLVAITVPLVALAAPAERSVERIRFVGNAGYGRVVIDLSGLAPFRTLELPAENGREGAGRVVVDLEGMTLGVGARQNLQIDGSLVSAIRSGQFRPGVARVVLDLASPASYRVFPLRDPYRLVVDLRGHGTSANDGAVVRVDSMEVAVRSVVPTLAEERSRSAESGRRLAAAPGLDPGLRRGDGRHGGSNGRSGDSRSSASQREPDRGDEGAPPAVTSPSSHDADRPRPPHPAAGLGPGGGDTGSMTGSSRNPAAARGPDPGRHRGDGGAQRPAAPGGGNVELASIETREPGEPATPEGPFRVMLDPGHGGNDPGAQSGGVREKDVVLSIARLLAEDLGRDPSIEVHLTRTDDRFLSLEERTALANATGADLFVSIHANASPRRGTHGVEVYYLNNTNNRGTLRLAAMENGVRWDPENPSLSEAIPELSYILSDLRQTYKVEESRVLADEIGGRLVDHLTSRFGSTQNLGTKEGPFYVLVGAHMPCVLVEVGFLTHPRERERLASRGYQREVAEGILRGIRNYRNKTQLAGTL